MSNYHVEPIDKPAGPDQGGDQVAAQAAGPGPVAPPADARRDRRRASACGCSRSPPARIGFVWPNLTGGFGAPIEIGDLDDGQGSRTRRCRSSEGFPAYYPEARAFVILYRPGPAAVHRRARTRPATARRSTSGRSTSAARTSAASRTRASRTSGSSARATARATTGSGSRPTVPQFGPAPRGMDRFSITVDGDGVLTINTGKITLGPLPVALGQPGPHPAAHADRAASDAVDPTRPPEGPDERHARRARAASPRSACPRPGRRPSRRRSSASPSPPSVRAVELTPERAAQVVRQSSNARWVGFLAVVVVILFIAIYWFYELGARSGSPSRGSRPRPTPSRSPPSSAATTSTRPTARAATASNGEGGIGPVLNRQDKLFAHLNEHYLSNVLVGRRPLRLRQPELAHAGLVQRGHPPGRSTTARSTTSSRSSGRPTTQTYIDPRRRARRARSRPDDRRGQDVHRLARPELQAGPGRDAVPGCWTDEFATPSGRPAPSGSPGASAAPGASARRLRRRARAAAVRPRSPSRRRASRSTTTERRRRRPTSRSDRLRQPGRRRPAQRRDQGRGRAEVVQGRDLHRRRDAATYDVPALDGRRRTRSSARCTRT